MDEKREPQNLRWANAVIGSRLSSKAKLVALVGALAYMNWYTLGDMRPGVPLLAYRTGLSQRGVQRAYDELCDAGWLRLVRRGHSGWASLYVGTWPKRAKAGGDGERQPAVALSSPIGEIPAADGLCVLCKTRPQEAGRDFCRVCAD